MVDVLEDIDVIENALIEMKDMLAEFEATAPVELS